MTLKSRNVWRPTFSDTMHRYHSEIGRMVDAAEITCKEKVRGECRVTGCKFHRAGFLHPCMVTDLWIILDVDGHAMRHQPKEREGLK